LLAIARTCSSAARRRLNHTLRLEIRPLDRLFLVKESLGQGATRRPRDIEPCRDCRCQRCLLSRVLGTCNAVTSQSTGSATQRRSLASAVAPRLIFFQDVIAVTICTLPASCPLRPATWLARVPPMRLAAVLGSWMFTTRPVHISDRIPRRAGSAVSAMCRF
jgi:hypothetical protein